jgi:glycosyltransferase involved in cell wall biosynthesis
MRRAFVLLLGSDIDVAGSLEDVAAGRPLDGLGPRPDARMALVSADLVVAQTSWQAQRVADATGRPAALVPSPIDLADATGPAGDADHAEVLWIGKADGIKRPDLALEVARRCPDLPFRIVANRVNESMFDQLASRAPANVMLVDHVAYERIGDVFRRARVLLNTSSFEGFPNAFLQAGKYGVPIVTAVVDPDGFLQRNGCGIVAGEEPEAIASAIRALAGGAQWRQRSAKIRAYVEQNHDAARCTAMLAEHLRRLVPACQFPATRLATA